MNNISTKEELIEKMLEDAEMDILTCALKDCEDLRLRERWEPFYKWIQTVN